MITNNERKKLLNQIINLSDQEKKKIIISSEWEGKVPKYLYRYRPLKEFTSDDTQREFRALEDSKIWGCKPSCYSGDDKEIIHPCAVEFNSSDGQTGIYLQNAWKFITGGMGTLNQLSGKIDNDVRELLIKTKKAYKRTASSDVAKKQLDAIMKAILTNNANGGKNNIDCRVNLDGKQFKEYRDNFVISCFTDKMNDDRFWTEYARNGEGFCLKYDFNKLYNDSQYPMYPMPVMYEDNEVDLGLNSNAVFFIKYEKYSWESEWRVVTKGDKKKRGVLINSILPEELICGPNIDDHNREELRKICREKIKFTD